MTTRINPAQAAAQGVAQGVAWLLRSTMQRPQTEAELATKLAGRGLEAGEVAAVLARARELGAVNDAAFAQAWVHDRGVTRGYGAHRLRRELRRRQVPQALADAALAQLDDQDEHQVATDLARQRMRTMPAAIEPAAAARRLGAFLQRRGYGPGLAQDVAIKVSGLGELWD